MNSKKIRVAIIIPGGIGTGRDNIGVPVLERQVILLANEFDVVVFSLFKVNSDYRPENFQIISIPAKRFLLKAWQLFTAFKKANADNSFDVIHGFWALPSGFLAVVVGKYFRIPSIVSVLGGDAVSFPNINYGQLRHAVPRQVVRWTVRNADTVTALTQYLVNSLEKHGIRRNDIYIVPWGIDNNQFSFKPVPIASPFTFLHIANFSAVKDPITLLKAFNLIAANVECHLTMIGEGPLQAVLNDWVASKGLSDRVTFKAPVHYKDIAAFYPQAMILLHTSLSEGQSEVVTEAMSSGVIVCGTRVGLMHDLPSCCVAVNEGDHEALATEVLKLIGDERRIALIRNAARDWTHTFNLNWTVNTIAASYRGRATKKVTADT